MLAKKKVVIAALVLALGTAVYLNWQFAGGGLDLTTLLQNQKNLGEAQFVNNPNPSSGTGKTSESDTYFAQSRLDRKKTRDEALEVLNGIINNEKLSKEEKQKSLNELNEISKYIEAEGKVESLVKAKGFADCVAYVGGESVTVIVKSEELTASQIAKIKDIVLSETKISVDKIKIYAK